MDLLHYKVILIDFVLIFSNHSIVSTSVNSHIVQSAATWFWNVKQVKDCFILKVLPNADDALKWKLLKDETSYPSSYTMQTIVTHDNNSPCFS